MGALATDSDEEAPGPPALPLWSVFPVRPPEALVERFLEHVRATGRPETFGHLSFTRPPKDTRLSVLCEFDAPRRLRPGGEMIPCPICSPRSPQYLSGFLIWCEATAAIYTIGRDCAAVLWQNNELDQAVTQYRRVREETRNDDALIELLPAVAAWRGWISAHLPLANTIDNLVRGFGRKASGLKYRLTEEMRLGTDLTVMAIAGHDEHGDRVMEHRSVGRLLGPRFLKLNTRLEAELGIRSARLLPYDIGDSDDDVIDWLCSATFDDKGAADAAIRRAQRDVERLAGGVADAVQFFSPANLALLEHWGTRTGRPISARRDAQRLTISSERQVWSAPIAALRVPDPLPPTRRPLR